ncbi:MAG TPA: CPBP family intramembrane glutamic endopeptidase [Anaerolineales bacterium]|nr:CPBP family intramembrane glutamic endopeptidase [Anaerolineales bacterium]
MVTDRVQHAATGRIGVESEEAQRRRSIYIYFGLTFLISWGIEFLLIASENGWGGIALPPSVHYLAAYGPMLAALLVTFWVAGGPGLRELLGRVTRWRVGWGWFLVSLLSPVALFAVGAVAARIVERKWPDLGLLGQVNYIPNLGLAAWLFWLVTYGLGEEIGWRGFALPRLQHGRSAAQATLILGLLWALWHLPAFFYLDTYQQMGLWMFPFLAVTIVCGAVVYTWIYNCTGGSVLMAAIFHASFNFFSASAAGAGTVAIVMTAGVVIASLVIPRVYGLENFARTPRHTL